MTLDSFRQMLLRLVKEAGSQRALAKKYGISPMFLCDILKGRRDPGEKFLSAMGYRREVVVRRDVKITKEN
jgi:hypothetical protein